MSTALADLLAGHPAPLEGLSKQRQAAAELWRRAGMPSVRQEGWRYTSLQRFQELSYRLAGANDRDILPETLAVLHGRSLVRTGNAQVILLNGQFLADHFDGAALPDGVTVQSLTQLSKQEPQQLPHHVSVGEGAADPDFSHLNLATLNDGLLIEVSEGVVIDRPLHILVLSVGDTGLMTTPRISVRLQQGARLSLIEEYLGADQGGGFTNAVTEIALERNAHLSHHRFIQGATAVDHIGSVVARQAEGSHLESDSIVLGACFCRVDIDVALQEREARCRLNGLFLGQGEDHIDHHTTIRHLASETRSEQLYRGVLDERSRGVFNGKVIVAESTRGIDAQQASNNLLLSAAAEIDAKPELQINADDVRCSHGATVGELDPDALFYLRSRGIAEEQARAMLIYAFAARVIDRIPLPELQDALAARLLGESTASLLPSEGVA